VERAEPVKYETEHRGEGETAKREGTRIEGGGLRMAAVVLNPWGEEQD